MQLPPDPSWCARINAPRPPPAAPSADGEAGIDAVPLPSKAEPRLPTGSPYRKTEVPTVHECELCGTVMYDHNCKIVCPNCGYKRDCSDP